MTTTPANLESIIRQCPIVQTIDPLRNGGYRIGTNVMLPNNTLVDVFFDPDIDNHHFPGEEPSRCLHDATMTVQYLAELQGYQLIVPYGKDIAATCKAAGFGFSAATIGVFVQNLDELPGQIERLANLCKQMVEKYWPMMVADMQGQEITQ